MKITKLGRNYIVLLVVANLMLAACEHNSKEWKAQNMIELSSRLQVVFKNTKTVCFGRFMVDLPESAKVVWGSVDVPLGIEVYPDGVQHVKELAINFTNDLKNEKAIYHNDVPLLFAVEDVSKPQGQIITGYEDFESVNDFQVRGYFKLNSDGVVIRARPLRDHLAETVALINSLAGRLRGRTEAEVPNEPGNCLEHAFLTDDSNPKEDDLRELVRIGFRLQEFPDTHLSIFLGPSNPYFSESNSLEWQLAKVERNLKAENPFHPQLKTVYLRRGTRKFNDWLEGFEALSHTPEQADIHGIHDFAMDVRGTPSDPFRPYFDVRMQTGVANNSAGATRASLTDEEAVAVWDKIVSSIRVRPTSAVSTKTAGTFPPRFPLGELAATGRTCPQTGWWQSSEPGASEGEQRKLIMAGDRMPHVTTLGAPSLWQKLKGEKPAYRTATTWKLVDYDDPSPRAEATRQTPIVAHAHVDKATPEDAADNTVKDGRNEEPPSTKKG
jgi:hypothetical protein